MPGFLGTLTTDVRVQALDQCTDLGLATTAKGTERRLRQLGQRRVPSHSPQDVRSFEELMLGKLDQVFSFAPLILHDD